MSSLCLMSFPPAPLKRVMLWKRDYPRLVTLFTWKSLDVRMMRELLGKLRHLAAASLMRSHPFMKEPRIAWSLSVAEKLASASPKWSSRASRLIANVWLYPPMRYWNWTPMSSSMSVTSSPTG
ncbi:hypothetical protein CBM2599_B50424 [Cupriavidus taiwanensis]|nr:hypothetical protein CBM2600_B10569 [Cupriavidus taiwanensis]SOY96492.1 hypothetical protein CBM2599_B50424 [Cupriavidus taiwanensis]